MGEDALEFLVKQEVRVTELESRVVEHLHNALVSDESCCVHNDTGFGWVPYRLAQWISVEEISSPTGQKPRCLARVFCALVEGVENPPAAVALASEVNSQATTSSVVYSPQDRVLFEASTVWLTPEGFGPSVDMLVDIATLQANEAHSQAPALAEALEGAVAVMGCSGGGLRQGPDSILDRWDEIAGLGHSQPSAFRGAPLLRMIGDGQPGWALMAFGDEVSASGELEFSGDSTAVEMALADRQGDPQTALLQVFTDTPHPDLGSGALLLLRLPVTLDAAEAAELANGLNEQEVRGGSGVSALGAWCVPPNDEGAVAFVTFVPSAMATHFDLEYLAWLARARSRWAHSALGELQGE